MRNHLETVITNYYLNIVESQVFTPINPLSANFTKLVKHTQTIRRLWPTNCLSVFDHFAGLVLKGLTLLTLAEIIVLFYTL